MNSIYNISCKVCYALAGIICTYMFINSMFTTALMGYGDEHTYFIKDFALQNIVGILFTIGIFVFYKKCLAKYLSKYFSSVVWPMRAITVLWLCLMFFWVTCADVNMVYDQKSVYEGIKQFLQGDLKEWQPGGYFYNYPMQNGLLFVFMPIVKVFGENAYAVVQGINIFCLWLIAFGCYRLARKYFDNIVAVFTYVSILMFVPLWGYVKYFYGNLIGLSLIVISIYWLTCYLDGFGKKYLFGSLSVALLAVVCKSNFSIFVIAMVIVLGLQGFKKCEGRLGIAGLLLLVAILVGMRGPAIVTNWLTGCVTNQGIPTIKWIELGLTESSTAPGWYSGDPFGWFAAQEYSVPKAKVSVYEKIENTIEIFEKNKWYTCRFFSRKFASIWNNPTFESFAIVLKGNTEGTLPYWMKDVLCNGGIANGKLTGLLDIWQSVYLFGVILYLLCCRKEKKLEEAIPLVALIGGVLFHIFWEGKCQYTVIYIPLLFPYVFGGYQECVCRVEAWFKHVRAEGFHFKKEICLVGKSSGIKGFIAICLLTLMIGAWDNLLFSSSIKFQDDTEVYNRFCREAVDWKADDYAKQ